MKNFIEFSKPISYNDFIANNPAHFSGIYILGFGVNFIPYYVGKHETCINSRVHSHYKGLTNTLNYTIFTENFYENLSDNNPIQRIAKPYEKYDAKFLARHLNDYHNYYDSHSVRNIIDKVFSKHNLFIAYADSSNLSNQKLTNCETAVKFCLKSNTIGRSGSLKMDFPSKICIKSKENCLSNHFHHFNPVKDKIDIQNNIYYGYYL